MIVTRHAPQTTMERRELMKALASGTAGIGAGLGYSHRGKAKLRRTVWWLRHWQIHWG